MKQLLDGILCCLIGYILGNFCPAYLFGKIKGYDIRKEGSGNVGATNAFLLVGKHAFFITATLDILKAFLACIICERVFPQLALAAPLAGSACVLGHIYPIVLGFHGGKGLAALGGVILAWHWQWFLLFLTAAIVIAFAMRYVCLVAPVVSVSFPACYYWKTGFLAGTLILIIPAIAIFIKHWPNFVSIVNGTEMRTDFIWDKENELKRIGQWNDKTIDQLKRRNNTNH